MVSRMEQEEYRFNAQADTGEEYIVIRFVEVHESRDLFGRRPLVFETLRYALEDGSAVMPIDDKTFKVVQTEEIIRKVD